MTRTTRDQESRVHEKRAEYNMFYLSPLEVPPGTIRDGYQGAWIRKDIKGQHDSKVDYAASRGWTPVPRDRAPSLNLDPLGRNPLATKFFCCKDTILMERPDELCKRQEAIYSKQTANNLQSLPGVKDDGLKLHYSSTRGF